MSELMAALSVLVATFTWLVTYFRDRHASRVAHTADILSNFSTCDRLAESAYHVTNLVNSNGTISMKAMNSEIECHVVNILDYYELLCVLYNNGILDRQTIIRLRGRLMKRTYSACRQYILDTRAAQKRPVYEDFEAFVHSLPFDD